MTSHIELTDDESDDDRRHLRRRTSDQAPPPSLSKMLGIALAVVSIATSLFTAGYNWRSVAIVEGNQDNFVRKDVQKQQLENVNDKLTEISRQLDEMRSELRAQRREPR